MRLPLVGEAGRTLSKIFLALIGIFVAVMSALAPANLFNHGPASPGLDPNAAHSGVTTEALATRSYDGATTFAKVSLLSAKVDGADVLDDAYGKGNVKEMVLKIGVKHAEGDTLLVGSEPITLHPTDTLVIRDFHGRYAFNDVRGLGATVQLDGTVDSTAVTTGGISNRLRTETDLPNVPAGNQDRAGDTQRVAYVVLDTGEKDTVAVERSASSRFYTWSPDDAAAKTGNATDGAVALLVQWVKLDGASVSQYTYGEGAVKKLEFETADVASDGAVLNFTGTESSLHTHTVVTVDDFVGTYLAFEVQGGMKLRLDGYARNLTTGDALAVLPPGTDQPPHARFTFSPAHPSTSDYVTFTDGSTDSDGVVVFHQWNFGDGGTTILPSPKHRFDKAGVYNVTLNVTDNMLGTGESSETVTVANTPPVSDWDFDPKAPHALDDVHFTNKSWDPDGKVVWGLWDFGDGTSLPAPQGSVVHDYAHAGNYTATLSVRDDDGATNLLSKVVAVLDSPPSCSFAASPVSPLSLISVNFTDKSRDPDGTLVAWSWAFGDGAKSTDEDPTHVYAASGTFTVSLTVTDDSHSQTTCSSALTVVNRPPTADFVFSPLAPTTNTEVRFTDRSVDADGQVVSWTWNFGDGTAPSSLQDPRHRFTSSAAYTTCLTVTDNSGGSAVPKCAVITVVNSPPVADFSWTPQGVHSPVTNQSVSFVDKSTDPDQTDTLRNWTWDFGDGAHAFDKNPTHRFTTKETFAVRLVVKDNHGNAGNVTHAVTIFDDPPAASFGYTPSAPTTHDAVNFTATASDSDGTVTNLTWNFGDGSSHGYGFTPHHRFTAVGTYTVTLTATDNDGSQTTASKSISIARAGANGDFAWSPNVPQPSEAVSFTDRSTPGDSSITKWDWDFGDGTAHGTVENPTHTYAQPGRYTITLTVTDSAQKTAKANHALRVNTKPTASFNEDRANVNLDQPVNFTNTSTDPDGFIRSVSWDFGDNTQSTEPNPTHSWASGGVFTITLTVTDNDGGNGVTTRTVNVANQPPHADFGFTPSPAERLGSVQFNDLSTDPDGDLQSWTWSFGDGSPTDVRENPTHVYAHSGKFTVSLTASDGQKTSTASKVVRVTSDHDLVLRPLTAKLPDGRLLDLSRPDVRLSLNFTLADGGGTTHFTKSSFSLAPGGTEAGFGLSANLWAAGDSVDVFVTLSGVPLGDANRFHLTLDDTSAAAGPLAHEFDVSNKLVPTLTVFDGTSDLLTPPLPDLRVPGAGVDGAVYFDPTEKIRVSGHVDWLDGPMALGSSVDVEIRYIGARGLENDLSHVPENPVTGWCHTFADVDANANFDLRIPGADSLVCGIPSPLTGTTVLAPGWYEVRVTAIYTGATSGQTAPSWVFEDPLGIMTGRFGGRDPPI